MDRATQRKLLRSAIIEVLEEYLNTQGFTVAQEKRIREIIREELPKCEIDSDCGTMIVDNRLQQLKEKANA